MHPAGAQSYGQLGVATIASGTEVTTPVAVDGGSTYAAVSGGNHNFCALDSSQTPWCWGRFGHAALLLQLLHAEELHRMTTSHATAAVALQARTIKGKLAQATSRTCGHQRK